MNLLSQQSKFDNFMINLIFLSKLLDSCLDCFKVSMFLSLNVDKS